MKNILSFIVIISMGLLVACGGSNTSSENARSASETSETGATLTTNFESGESTTGELRIEYTITSANGETLAGTIHWGDNTTSRISGTGEAAHRYRGTGTVSVNVQLDDGSLFRLGQLSITGGSGVANGSGSLVTLRENFTVRGPASGANNQLADQKLRFNLSDVMPVGNAQFTLTALAGDLDGGNERFTIRVNGRAIRAVDTNSQCIRTNTSLNFTIPLADLITERNSNSGMVEIVFVAGSGVGNICNAVATPFGGNSDTFASGTLSFSGRPL